MVGNVMRAAAQLSAVREKAPTLFNNTAILAAQQLFAAFGGCIGLSLMLPLLPSMLPMAVKDDL